MRKLSIDEMNRLSVEEYKSTTKTPVIIVLENIRSLNNIGAIFRTCDAFAIEAVYLVGITAKPPHREIQKTALGATESVDWKHFEHFEQAAEIISTKNYHLFALEQVEGAVLLHEHKKLLHKTGVAIVVGNEVNGVEQSTIDLCEACIEIPQLGTKHSLNVAVSAGIILWELFNSLKK